MKNRMVFQTIKQSKASSADLRLVVDQLARISSRQRILYMNSRARLDESKQCERDQASRKIKEILKDKIREGKITAKWIEDCLPPEYKRK